MDIDHRTVYDGTQPITPQARFLACVAVSGSITQACRWAKITRGAHYNWLDRDPAYKPRFDQAMKRAASVLADEAVRRAHEGVRRAVYYKGKVVGYETVYSDGLLIRMLEALEPKTYAPRLKQEHTGKDGEQLFSLEAVREYMKQAPEAGEE
jgi:hypothetical protein